MQRVITYSDLTTTPAVLDDVITDLDLDLSPKQLAELVSASAPFDTSITDITVTDTDPVRAADITNATAASLTSAVESLERPAEVTQSAPIRLSQIQQAVPNDDPVSPNVPLNLALGLLIGLAVGVGLAVLRETLDTRIHSQKNVEDITSVPVIGGTVFDAKAKTHPLIVHADPKPLRS